MWNGLKWVKISSIRGEFVSVVLCIRVLTPQNLVSELTLNPFHATREMSHLKASLIDWIYFAFENISE
jgi:hypothetical protein